jgi:hypothetical protein
VPGQAATITAGIHATETIGPQLPCRIACTAALTTTIAAASPDTRQSNLTGRIMSASSVKRACHDKLT